MRWQHTDNTCHMLSLLVSQRKIHWMLQLKQLIRGSSWSELDDFNTFNSAARLQWQKLYCASGQTQQTRVEDNSSPYTELNRLTQKRCSKRQSWTNCGCSVVGKPQTDTGLSPFPPLRIALEEWEGRVGGNPAIVLAQTCRRWINENKFHPEQKHILLFNRRIGLHNHTICTPS